MDQYYQIARNIYKYVETADPSDCENYYLKLSELLNQKSENTNAFKNEYSDNIHNFTPYVPTIDLGLKQHKNFYKIMRYASESLNDVSLCFEYSLRTMNKIIIEITEDYLSFYNADEELSLYYSENASSNKPDDIPEDEEFPYKDWNDLSIVEQRYAPEHKASIKRIRDFHYTTALYNLCSAFESSLSRIVYEYNWPIEYDDSQKGSTVINRLTFLKNPQTLNLKLEENDLRRIRSIYKVRNCCIHGGNLEFKALKMVQKNTPNLADNDGIHLTYMGIMDGLEVCGRILAYIEFSYFEKKGYHLDFEDFKNNPLRNWRWWYKHHNEWDE